MDILAELDFILEDCGPLFSNYDANIGSFMLHEVNAASGSLLNTMANACAHAVMLTRFCDTLKVII